MNIEHAISGLTDQIDETWATPLQVRTSHQQAKVKAQRVSPQAPEAKPAPWLTAPRIGWTAFQMARAEELSREPAARHVSGAGYGGPIGSKTPRPVAFYGNDGEV